MTRRVAAWGGAGFVVAVFWACALFPSASLHSASIVTLAGLSCPVAFVNFGVRFYRVLLANAATYALIGLAPEIFRPRTTSPQI